jgi:nucleotide-binding universal stress UspA family protein
MQIRSVLAATDLSAAARRAADRAAMLAKMASASLTLAHVVKDSALEDLRRWIEERDTAQASILEDVRRRVHALAVELGARYAIEVAEHTSVGRPVDEIARIADECEADLIVAGTLGARVLSHVVGSTAERIVRKSTRPVLMVRHEPRDAYRRVLVPVDFSRWSAASIEAALAVAPDAHIVLVHCVEVPFESRLRVAGVRPEVIERYRADARRESMQQLAGLAREAGLDGDRWTPLTPHGLDPWKQIVEQEQEQDCDLTVIGRHGRHALEALLLGSTTNMVIAEGRVDVLVSVTAQAA